jgi:ABC-type phosphate transport system substrate-binding protein
VLALLGLCWLCAAASLTLSLDAASQAPDGYQIIAHEKNPANTASREFLADVFLKRASRWESSQNALPVDQRMDSRVRKTFSLGVLKRPVTAVRSYWTQRIFSGRDVPPPELGSDEAVGRFVASHPGAVGYISSGPTPAGTKRLEVR